MATPVVDVKYVKEIEKACRDLRALISRKNCAPIMLHLVWHNAGTYDVKTKTGGPNGSIRNRKELNHSANSGLRFAVDLCVKITGGPSIDFVPEERIQINLQKKDAFKMPNKDACPSRPLLDEDLLHPQSVVHSGSTTHPDGTLMSATCSSSCSSTHHVSSLGPLASVASSTPCIIAGEFDRGNQSSCAGCSVGPVRIADFFASNLDFD